MADRKLIRNDVVSMDWWSDCFFESREKGFVAACQTYETEVGTFAVGFMNNNAFVILKEDGDLGERKDIQDCAKDCNKYEEEPWDGEWEDKVMIVSTEDGKEFLQSNYGFTDEDIEDIENRLNDLSGYWYSYMEDMG